MACRERFKAESCLKFDQMLSPGVPFALYNGLHLMPTVAPESLVNAELERQIFRREGPEEGRRIERLARRKSTAAASSSV